MEFDEFVKAHHEAKEVPSREKAEKQIQFFNNHLKQLFDIAYEALDPYINDGSVEISPNTKTIVEEELCGYRNYSYQAHDLSITLGDAEVKLTPIGMRIFGAIGRVDMIGSRGEVSILLTGSKGPKRRVSISSGEKSIEAPVQETTEEPVWKFIERSPNINYFDVNEDTFKKYLMMVIDG